MELPQVTVQVEELPWNILSPRFIQLVGPGGTGACEPLDPEQPSQRDAAWTRPPAGAGANLRAPARGRRHGPPPKRVPDVVS